ncbi:hypothetical protein DH2020_004984 [Rehmannia glutinosa]|uniref:Ankyrin repeat protein n=1 Tax=Rehmannia glutinosa TaxID=99300 RepID=A0ABR0XR90_REHGL
MEEPQCSEIEMMEMEVAEVGVSSLSNEIERGTEIVAFSSEKSEGGCHGNVIFSREAPLSIKEDLNISAFSCGADKLKSKLAASDSDNGKNERKLSRQDRIELGRLFQGAVSSLDWELAESLILLADSQTLNDVLCISLDSIWFLHTQQELYGITRMIKMIIANGAYDFTELHSGLHFLLPVLSERLQECNGDEVLKAEAGVKVQKFTEWALKCISFHSRSQGNMSKVCHNSAVEIQLQLSAFKTFLDLAGNHLTGKDFSEAFDAACFPLTLFSSTFDHGWASGTSATAIQGLLGMLVEGGADNVNQCFLEASRFGSTELVHILLQIAQRNSLDVDVDLALGFASHYGKISTMECLVEEGNAMAFLGPLMRAAERGCMPVVQWFVQRGCRDMELCLALTAATSSSQVDAAAHLLLAFLITGGFLGWIETRRRTFLEHRADSEMGGVSDLFEGSAGPLRVAIAYLPLYRECVKAGGSLLSQRHRGQLVVAARRLGAWC